ncbi:MAG TPA: hypothetical protein VF615_10200 [Longimicrobiaceae bacterium]
MTYMLFALLLVLVGAAALAAAQAFRSEHLVVFSHRGGEVFVMERGADGRYELIAPVQGPAAVLRFARARTTALAKSAPQAALRHVPGRPFQALRGDRGASTAHA